MLTLQQIHKYYQSGENRLHVLKGIDLQVSQGEFIAIMGPSGSGKSTLLAIAAGLDTIDSGQIQLADTDITGKKEDFLSKLRAEKIGFIFQNFQLIKTLNAIENVSLPLVISEKRYSETEISQRAEAMLGKVSMQHRLKHYPGQLSGGEQQRVAIARSFINEPAVLFADEPTGNLDKKNAEMVMQLLVGLNRDTRSTLIIVTHDPKVAEKADLVYEMADGELQRKDT
ncbi:MAG: ABC transporter ATP-binding protein [Spirochaetota bacterium]